MPHIAGFVGLCGTNGGPMPFAHVESQEVPSQTLEQQSEGFPQAHAHNVLGVPARAWRRIRMVVEVPSRMAQDSEEGVEVWTTR